MDRDLDIDFENFKVADDKARVIRDLVDKIKNKSWAADLRTVVEIQGVEESSESENVSLPGFVKDKTTVRLVKFPEGHSAHGYSITLNGVELRVSMLNKVLLELTYLPKNDDCLICYVNDAGFSELQSLMVILQTELEAAKQVKRDRQAVFKARFQKEVLTPQE